jgi:LPS-assembly protein
MRHFSKSVVPASMKPVLLRCPARRVDGRAVATAAGAADGDLPDPQLKLAPDIESPGSERRRDRREQRPAATPGPPLLTPLPGVKRATPRATGAPRAAGDDEDRGAIFLRADRIEGEANTRVEASGKVELRSRRETVLADWLQYDFIEDEIWGKGNVTLRRGIDTMAGPEMKFQRDTETGYFKSPRYSVGEIGAHGEATEIRFLGPNNFEASSASYTTCVAPNHDWYLIGDEIEVDKLRSVGTAHHAKVYFLDVPLIATPWLEFPLTNERKSGFLTPLAGSSQVRGFELATPYYFNLAPNYDATVTPRLMTKRGLMMEGEGRYLFEPAVGEIIAQILPYDRVADTSRWAFSWKHNQQLQPWLTGYFNYNRVSDSNYFADFSDRIAVTSQKTLPQEFGLNATYGPFLATVLAESFQTLQDPAAPVTPPYNMLPQVRVTMSETDWAGLTWSGNAQYTHFTQSSLVPTGDRAVLYPSVRWIQQGSSWFLNAHAAAQLWQYDLNQSTASAPSTHPSVVVPIASVDAGLIFERDWTVFGKQFIQTLEPRAFYTYIPFRQQNQLPVFDTVQDDFNFAQLFIENRFVGYDRVGDANQLALAITSRLLDPATGAERLRVGIGQLFYFSDQQVTLGGAPQKAGSSDFLLGVEGRLSDTWALTGLMQYNFGTSDFDRFNAGVRYTPSPGRALSVVYRYSKELVDQTGGQSELNQTYISGQWPLADNWSFIGAWNYSIPDHKTLEAVVGLEYNGGCWVVRVVGQQLTTTSEQTTRSIFVQLELNGLARVGTSPLDLLRRTVPGYLRTNDPASQVRDPAFYQLPDY